MQESLKNDQDFFYFHIVAYLADASSPDVAAKMNDLLKKQDFQVALKAFQGQKGILQEALSEISLASSEQDAIRDIVQPAGMAMSIEASTITELGERESRSGSLRIAMLISVAIVCGWLGFKFISPRLAEEFRPLESLSYEALVLDEDDENERLLLPSTEVQEVQDYLDAIPASGFNPKMLSGVFAKGWQIEGASLIDYEVAKIAVVKYRQNRDGLYFFTLAGNIDKLPRSELVVRNQRTFLPFASDRINILCWQIDAQTLGMLASRVGMEGLLALAASQ
jgi:hypothetical protein